MNEPLPLELVRRCLPTLGGARLRVTRLPGGGNNRLYRIDGPEGPLVLKHYFRHPEQQRDRLGAEFAFLTYAWGLGLRCIPRPLGKDDVEGAGLYGFLPGRPLRAEELGLDELRQALTFLTALNGGERPGAQVPVRARPGARDPGRLRPGAQDHGGARPGARELGPASEACFSVADHLRLVEGRIDRLLALEPHDDVDAAAVDFLRRELAPAWRTIRARLLSRLAASRPPWAASLAPAARLVSPSDFGFHNALRGDDGRLAFLDFEYGGWDDPAKLICDLFFQPAVPAPPEAFEAMARGVAALGPDPAGTLARVEALWPVLGLKWCCILLNHFSTVDLARRSFAAADASGDRPGQLAKARRLLERLDRLEGGTGTHG